MDRAREAALKEEATRMFVGRGGVIGVAQSGARGLTVLIETEDAPERQAVRDWAAAKKVEVSFLVSGRLGGIGQA